MCVLCKELYVAELIIFQFPWNSQGIASLFTTGTFPGFGHVTSQMSHSQWSNRKEETCPNWELVLCTLNKKLHMFLNAMVQRKKKTTPKQFGPNHICCSRFWSLDITVGFSMATVAGCKSLLLRLAYTKILLEMRKVCKFRGWIYYKTSTGAFPQFFFCNFLSYLWCYWMNAPRV